MPSLFAGNSVVQLSIAQAGPAALDLVAAPTGRQERIFVVRMNIGMAVAGTIKFTEGTGPTDITGALPLPTNGGFVLAGTSDEPVLWTPTVNSKLSLVSVTGAAQGWIHYYISSQTP
jgi:hypothetical protein